MKRQYRTMKYMHIGASVFKGIFETYINKLEKNQSPQSPILDLCK